MTKISKRIEVIFLIGDASFSYLSFTGVDNRSAR